MKACKQIVIFTIFSFALITNHTLAQVSSDQDMCADFETIIKGFDSGFKDLYDKEMASEQYDGNINYATLIVPQGFDGGEITFTPEGKFVDFTFDVSIEWNKSEDFLDNIIGCLKSHGFTMTDVESWYDDLYDLNVDTYTYDSDKHSVVIDFWDDEPVEIFLRFKKL